MSYRTDNRTKTAFKKDIKRSHENELDIAIRIALLDFNSTGKWPIINPNGSDMSGNYIADDNKVSHDPDYLIGDRLVEITRADILCKKAFHQKVSKVNLCIKNNVNIVFVNGYTINEVPDFIEINAKEIKSFTDKAIKTHGVTGHPTRNGYIFKDSYRYDLAWFDGLWKKLPPINSAAQSQYKDLIASIRKSQ